MNKKVGVDFSGLDIKKIREKLKSIGMVRYTAYEKGFHEL